MADPMRQFGLFLLNKAPAGIVDLFNDEKGSGAKTWMNLGMIWLTLAGIGTFLSLWHDYDGSALDSLASIYFLGYYPPPFKQKTLKCAKI